MDMVEPNPPDEFTVRPESHKERVVITWKVPYNPQKDIYYFILYRKLQDSSGKDASDWEQLDVRLGAKNNIYFDNEVEFFQDNKLSYVYAAQTVTRHNEHSLLSCQRAVRLNSEFKFSGEFPIAHVSEDGVSLDAIGAFATKPPRRVSNESIANSKILLTARRGVHKNPFRDATYCLRIESLDTGQIKDVVLDFKYDDLRPDVEDKEGSVVVQTEHLPRSEEKLRDFVDSVISVGTRGKPKSSKADRGRQRMSHQND